MKKLFALCLIASFSVNAEDASVTVSTSTVEKTVKREPREVVFKFSRATGAIEADITYESVVRVDGAPVAWETIKVVTLKWADLTNAAPALTQAFEQFKAAAKSSMTNTP